MSDRDTLLHRLYLSPFWLISLVAASVFIAEAVVMFLTAQLPPFSIVASIALDSTLLLILLTPVIIYFFFRPLLTQITEYRRTEGVLALERNKLQCILGAMDVLGGRLRICSAPRMGTVVFVRLPLRKTGGQK